jgi:predicted ester cyclase
MSTDYVLHGAPEVRGPEGMKHFVTMYRTAFPDYTCTVEDQVAEGDKVVTRWTVRGTQHGELMGIPPTGRQVTLPGVVIDRSPTGSWLRRGSRQTS